MVHSNNRNLVNNSSQGTGMDQPQQATFTNPDFCDRFTPNDLCDTLDCALSMYLNKVEIDFHKNPKSVPYEDIVIQCEYIRKALKSTFTNSNQSQHSQEVQNG